MKYGNSFAFWSFIFSTLSVVAFSLYLTIGVPYCEAYMFLPIPTVVSFLWLFIVRFNFLFFLLSVLFLVISFVLKLYKEEEVGRPLACISLCICHGLYVFSTLFQNADVKLCGFF